MTGVLLGHETGAREHRDVLEAEQREGILLPHLPGRVVEVLLQHHVGPAPELEVIAEELIDHHARLVGDADGGVQVERAVGQVDLENAGDSTSVILVL